MQFYECDGCLNQNSAHLSVSYTWDLLISHVLMGQFKEARKKDDNVRELPLTRYKHNIDLKELIYFWCKTNECETNSCDKCIETENKLKPNFLTKQYISKLKYIICISILRTHRIRNRKRNDKLSNKITYPMFINETELIVATKAETRLQFPSERNNATHELYGITVHQGGRNQLTGHYVFWYHQNGIWYNMNDTIVTRTNRTLKYIQNNTNLQELYYRNIKMYDEFYNNSKNDSNNHNVNRYSQLMITKNIMEYQDTSRTERRQKRGCGNSGIRKGSKSRGGGHSKSRGRGRSKGSARGRGGGKRRGARGTHKSRTVNKHRGSVGRSTSKANDIFTAHAANDEDNASSVYTQLQSNVKQSVLYDDNEDVDLAKTQDEQSENGKQNDKKKTNVTIKLTKKQQQVCLCFTFLENDFIYICRIFIALLYVEILRHINCCHFCILLDLFLCDYYNVYRFMIVCKKWHLNILRLNRILFKKLSLIVHLIQFVIILEILILLNQMIILNY